MKLRVAMWGANNGDYPGLPNLGGAYPTWSAHQYTSSGSTGGIAAVDLNVAKPSAFEIVDGPPTEPPTDDPLPKSTTDQDGVPGPIMWMRAQNWLSGEFGYHGPIDGARGPNSWRGFARFLNQDQWD